MRGKLESTTVPEKNDRELDVFAEFAEAERDGKNPDIEEYLGRVPESAARLRPSLQAVVEVGALIRKLEAVYSAEELARLLDPSRRPKRR